MAKKLFVPFLFLLFAFSGMAQGTAADKAESERLQALNKKLEGTYQIQVVNSRELPSFPLKYLDTIESMRSETETVYFQYPENKNIRIMIPSKTAVRSPGFVKLKHIQHVTQ